MQVNIGWFGKRAKIQKLDENSGNPDQALSNEIYFHISMELINYQELKREAYLMAIEKLEEEYANDQDALRKLEQYKNQHLIRV